MRKTLGQALESLERRVVQGFERVDRRLDGIDGRLDRIDGRLDGHDSRFERIDKQSLEAARRFDSVDKQLLALDTKVEGLRAEMHGQFDAVYQRLDRLETEYHMLVVGIRRIEEQMAEDRDDRARLLAQVADLLERVKELEERLKELQARLDEEEQAAPPNKPS